MLQSFWEVQGLAGRPLEIPGILKVTEFPK